MSKIKTYEEALKIWREFGLKVPQLPLDECIFYNAERLLEIKNSLLNIEKLAKKKKG